jgi:hypothetical protein
MTSRERLRRRSEVADRLRTQVSLLRRELAAERHYSTALTRLARSPACKLALREFRRASTRKKKLTPPTQ